MSELTIDIVSEPTHDDTPDDDSFESPNGSKWIVAVDQEGFVSILKAPNIHYGFFDGGSGAEEIGLPFEVDGEPGVYEWTCNASQTHCYETGCADGIEFDVIDERCLWSLGSQGDQP